MAFCEQCRVSVGWFGKKKFRMEDGRTIVVCATCAERLQRQAELAARSTRTFDAPSFHAPSEPSPPAPAPSDAAPEGVAASLAAAVDDLMRAHADGNDGRVQEVLAKFAAAGTTSSTAFEQTVSSSVKVQTPRGAFEGTGEDAVAAIERLLTKRFLAATGLDLGRDAMAATRVREGAQAALKALMAGQPRAKVNLPFITADGTGPRHLDETVSLEDLVGA